MSIEEFEIFAAGQRGDLVRRAERLLQSTSAAEDVVQDALLKLFTMRSRLDDYHSPAALARTVVRHLSLNAIRDRKSVAAIDMARMTADEEAPDEGELAGRLARPLAIMDSLPASQQMIMRMKHVDGMEVEQIARAAACSREAVYAALSRGRRAIVERFKNRVEV